MPSHDHDAARWVEEVGARLQRAHEERVLASGLQELLRDVDRAAAHEDDVRRQAELRTFGDRLAAVEAHLHDPDVVRLDLLGRALARDVDDRAEREGWFRRGS